MRVGQRQDFQPSLRDYRYSLLNPAVKRWAIIVVPPGPNIGNDQEEGPD
jgi:hypothetical protein